MPEIHYVVLGLELSPRHVAVTEWTNPYAFDTRVSGFIALALSSCSILLFIPSQLAGEEASTVAHWQLTRSSALWNRGAWRVGEPVNELGGNQDIQSPEWNRVTEKG